MHSHRTPSRFCWASDFIQDSWISRANKSVKHVYITEWNTSCIGGTEKTENDRDRKSKKERKHLVEEQKNEERNEKWYTKTLQSAFQIVADSENRRTSNILNKCMCTLGACLLNSKLKQPEMKMKKKEKTTNQAKKREAIPSLKHMDLDISFVCGRNYGQTYIRKCLPQFAFRRVSAKAF